MICRLQLETARALCSSLRSSVTAVIQHSRGKSSPALVLFLLTRKQSKNWELVLDKVREVSGSWCLLFLGLLLIV